EKQRKGLADYFAPSIPIHLVSSGSNDPFGGVIIFSEDTLRNDGRGSTRMAESVNTPADGDSGFEINIVQEAQEEQALRDAGERLMGRGGESLVSTEALKHIVTRVTDEGLIIELFATPEVALFEADTDEPADLLRQLTAMIARVTAPITNGVAISGHVPAYPLVKAENPVWDLSAARASRTRTLLEAGGMDDQRLRRVTGHADRKPVVENPMSVRNDRVEITLLRRSRDR
ncbi:MAG: flagellar motor protein MotB, partial [Arenibacterium sp.]